MTETLNVALLGYGMAGKAFHAPLVAATPGLRLHSVVSRNAAAVMQDWPDARVLVDPQAAFANPEIDVVVIATPDDLHAPQGHAALAAGKHVVIDKPFAASLQEAESLAAHAAQAGRVLSVFHNRRWDSDFLTLGALVASGQLGRVSQFESHFDRFRPVSGDRWKDRRRAGVWFDLGPHLVDQALCLFGAPLAIYADLGRQRPDAPAIDYFHVLLRYERLRVILHASHLTLNDGLRFAVHGDRGSFIKHGLDPQAQALHGGQRPGGVGWGVDPRPGELMTVADGKRRPTGFESVSGDYSAFYRGLHEAIVGGGPNPASPEQALAVMRVLELGLQSVDSHGELAFS
ncbi:MAG TPA: oxidoreductase [Caulobacteraceae bacterium]|jgi:predicted dehydrogenase